MACLLLSILLKAQVSKKPQNHPHLSLPKVPNILDTQLPLVLVTLDLLANTGTLNTQTQLDPLA
jgi:hypothetical protein